MGNRVYVTLIDKGIKTFYLHWNGGLDTWLPLTKVAFEIDQKGYKKITTNEILSMLDHLGIRYEQSDDCFNKVEENGHYYIDLINHTFKHKTEVGNWHTINNFKDAFEKYIVNYIMQEYRDNIRENYWRGIQTRCALFLLGVEL